MPGNGDETVDELAGFGLQVCQPRHGYRFSLDPLLLCDFADVSGRGRIMDLGTGCGIIPLILARISDSAEIVGVEHQEAMAGLARRNVLRNGLSGRVSVLHEDVTRLKKRFPVSFFDLVVANPPYRKQGTGRLSPKPGRDLARHESTAALADFISAAKYLAAPSGSICIIHHPIRLAELLAQADCQKLAPLRLRMVHGHREAEAGMFLIELAKGRKGDLRVLPPLFVYDGKGNYTGEMMRINRGERTRQEKDGSC